MKKLLAIMFCIALTLGLYGCKAETAHKAEPLEKTEPITIGETYSDFGGVNIKITKAIVTDTEHTLKTEWVNQTVYEVLYGESFAIERYQDGKWVSCKKTKEEVIFNMIGYCLKPSSAQEKTYSFFDIFDISKSGKYRIITNCFVYNNGKDAKAQECRLLAEFTVNCIIKTEPLAGYCGNTLTTVTVGKDKYTFMGGDSVALTDILLKLDYTDKVCNCSPEYTVDTEFGIGYGVNITESYVKYKGKQAELTLAQTEKIKAVFERVKAQNPDNKE